MGGLGERTVTIESLGAHGDGQTRLNGQSLAVSGALPGETVRALLDQPMADGWRGEVVAIETPSPDRVAPPCPHFEACGGCTLQHYHPTALAAWKQDLIATALARRGLTDVAIEATVSTPPGSRRRATLAWHRPRGGTGCNLGFHARGSHRLAPLETCLLLTPTLVALLAPLKEVLSGIARAGDGGRIIMTETETGADVTLGLPMAPDLATREHLATFAEAHDLARLGLILPDGGVVGWEPVAERHPPLVSFAGVAVRLPPEAFLQPSEAGAQAMTEATLARLPAADGPILDLFAGVGTLSLPLATRGWRVHAVEGDAAAVAALSAAARSASITVTTESRDLARDPLAAEALRRVRAVVFDPPRAGARTQAALIASDGPDDVVAVSCNPATFARDARLLVDGGYRLESVTPIDQFPWSAHVELVAGFRRTGA